jgi:lipopolysaccharide biosynthesis glycosyltransferase
MAQAKTLGDSLKKTNPEIQYFIGLVDRLEGITFSEDHSLPYTLLEVHQIGISQFDQMCEDYNITELNTAVKPYFFSYFFNKYKQAEKVIYFDPDIIIYQHLTQLLKKLDYHSAVVTPHICSPIEDTKTPNELHHLNTGVFNLGFCAFRRSTASLDFITWWELKLRDECKISLCEGLFVDQNWMNFVTLFLPDTYIEKDLGYNVAYWNLHERRFSQFEENYYINDTIPLIFFHYSGYDPRKPEELSKYQNRFRFDERMDLKSLFENYHTKLLENGNDYFRAFPCKYIKPEKVYKYQRVRKALIAPLTTLLKIIDTA